MKVLENYIRKETPLIEGLTLNEDEQLVPKLAATAYQDNMRTEQNGTPITLYKIRKSNSIPDFSLTKSWKRYPIDLHIVLHGSGTYVIQIIYGAVIYSGIFSYVDSTAADIEEEIILNAGGSFNRSDLNNENEGILYAKISLPTESLNNEAIYPQLYLASSIPETNANSMIQSIKFRKLI